MTFYLNKTEARIHGRNNLTIFDEVHDIMRKVIVASDAGSGGSAQYTCPPNSYNNSPTWPLTGFSDCKCMSGYTPNLTDTGCVPTTTIPPS